MDTEPPLVPSASSRVFWVTINGENFLIELEGSVGKYGFFTHRCVLAESPDAAEMLVIESLQADEKLRTLVRNQPSDPPTMTLDEIYEIEAIDPNCPSGLVWYEINTKRWWQFWKRR